MTWCHVSNQAIESFSSFVSRAALTLINLWKGMPLHRQTQSKIDPSVPMRDDGEMMLGDPNCP